MKDFDDFINLLQNGTMDFILITKVSIRFKKSDLGVWAKLPFVGIFAKQEHGRICIVSSIGQAELFHQICLWFRQNALVNPSLFCSQSFEFLNQGIINIVNGEAGEGHIIPGSAPFAENEAFQFGTGERLHGASAAVIVNAFAGNSNRIGRNYNFNIFFSIFL